MSYIERCQRLAVAEHLTHTLSIGSVQIFQACNGFQIIEFIKHFFACWYRIVFETLFYDYRSGTLYFFCPIIKCRTLTIEPFWVV